MSELPHYVLERTFDAPPALVWRAWTDPDLVNRWYGPGVETVIHRLEPKPGGLWLLEMRMGEKSFFQRAEYTEATPHERLVWLHANADADWNIVANPMMANWPRVLLTTVTFDEAGAQTKLRLTWTPHEANEDEISCFAGALEGMDKGWAAGMKLLAELLEELKSQSGT